MVRQDLALALRVLDPHDVPQADEEAGHADGVLQQAAAVAREVEDESIRLGLCDFREQPRHVVGALAL